MFHIIASIIFQDICKSSKGLNSQGQTDFLCGRGAGLVDEETGTYCNGMNIEFIYSSNHSYVYCRLIDNDYTHV